MNFLLNKRQREMISLIQKGISITEIARILNVSRRTIYNWLEKEEIKSELDNKKALIAEMIDLAKNSEDKTIKYNAIKYLLDSNISFKGMH